MRKSPLLFGPVKELMSEEIVLVVFQQNMAYSELGKSRGHLIQQIPAGMREIVVGDINEIHVMALRIWNAPVG